MTAAFSFPFYKNMTDPLAGAVPIVEVGRLMRVLGSTVDRPLFGPTRDFSSVNRRESFTRGARCRDFRKIVFCIVATSHRHDVVIILNIAIHHYLLVVIMMIYYSSSIIILYYTYEYAIHLPHSRKPLFFSNSNHTKPPTSMASNHRSPAR